MAPKKAATAAANSKAAAKTTKAKATTSKKTGAKAPTNGASARVTKKASPAKATKATKSTTKTNNRAATKSSSPPDAEEPQVNGVKTEPVSKKRKASDEPPPASPTKKAKPSERKIAAPKKSVASKQKVVINDAPTQKLDVYVFGQGENAELGLGAGKKVSEVKRPRLNPLLAASSVGIVQIACGGMHTAALSFDSKIYTWGVNDQGALGRDTAWEGGLKDMDASDSEDEDDPGMDLNPHEATPTAIDSSFFPKDTVFTQLAAGDSCTFALTDEGLVYGWGTFRVSPVPLLPDDLLLIVSQGNEGIIGFSGGDKVQKTPILIQGLKKIVKIACGENHVLALDQKGTVFAWGSGQQNQLGRRIVERTKAHGFTPREFGLPKGITDIYAGNNHSFAIHKSGKVYTWGLNSFGETGISENAGEDEAAILHPAVIDALTGKNITCMAGGSHHSVAVTSAGECLVWGRIDGYQCGIKVDSLPKESVIVDSRDHPRILKEPTAVPGIDAVYAAAGSDHCIAIDKDGKAYSWGFSAVYQTGLGTSDDVEVATHIDNTAVRGKKLTWAGAGGQFSIVAGIAEGQQGQQEQQEQPKINGVANGINGHAGKNDRMDDLVNAQVS